MKSIQVMKESYLGSGQLNYSIQNFLKTEEEVLEFIRTSQDEILEIRIKDKELIKRREEITKTSS